MTPSITIREKLSEIIDSCIFYGWEQGKKQKKTPYDYTLVDDTFARKKYDAILSVLREEIKKKKITGRNKAFVNSYNMALDDLLAKIGGK